MHAEPIATRSTYAGLLFVTLATLMYEILLTRIFSVTSYYHFAFMAISIAMFGMTVGAVLVYLRPARYTAELVKAQLAKSALLFAITILVSFLTQLVIPSVMHPSLTGLYAITFKYVVISIPFVFSGICVALALTRFPKQVSRLYAADLVGAAMGCIAIVYALRIGDGPTTVVWVATLAAVGAVSFALDAAALRWRRAAIATTVILALFATLNTAMARRQHSLLSLMWVKGALETRPLHEKWNSFSRITVGGEDKANTPYMRPFGWGLSSVYPTDRTVEQYGLLIDGMALTPITKFDGDLGKVDYLKYDVTNIVHNIRPAADVFVIGAGGGRDVLSALAFNQKSVLAVELNGDIVRTLTGRFGDFSGHLDRDSRVHFVNDEARSYLASHDVQYDIIQISLIDTWAATAAGAFVLSENQLYTAEAWTTFLKHLKPGGVLSVSRWYFRDRPGEVYRTAALAVEGLRRAGVDDPRGRIVVVRNMIEGNPWWVRVPMPEGIGVGTILVSNEPFSETDVNTLESVAKDMRYEMMQSPRHAVDPTFATIAAGKDLEDFYGSFPLNIAPPTDNNPFFFQMLRFRDMFRPALWRQGPNTPNLIAVLTLGVLLVCVTGLSVVCIIVPLALTARREMFRGALPLFIYFTAIGLGFMLIEVSQMQRLIVFLGHPTYGLSVLLFTLLLSAGAGSFFTGGIGRPGMAGSPAARLVMLLVVLVGFALIAPRVMVALEGAAAMLRILAAVLLLAPVGFFLGMAFPIGMKMAAGRAEALTPWLWGINGAASVCAAVIGVVISLGAGIAASYLTGVACYVVALLALMAARTGRMSVAESLRV
jgi:SAM-dependent methyltransferase